MQHKVSTPVSSRNLGRLLFRAAIVLWWLSGLSASIGGSNPAIVFAIGNGAAVFAAIYWLIGRAAPATTGNANRLNLENSGAGLLKGPNARR